MNFVENAKCLIVPIIEEMGYEVVEVSFKNVYDRNTLEVLIYKDGGITLDDCVKVNDALYLPLEENDITSGLEYNLNISSPGLDRPIITKRDFERNIGVSLDIELINFIEENRFFTGKLMDVEEDEIIINIKGKNTKIKIKDINSAKVHIKF